MSPDTKISTRTVSTLYMDSSPAIRTARRHKICPGPSLRTSLQRHGWRECESAGPTRIHGYIQDPGGGIRGEELPRRQLTLLNRLRTGVGRYKASMRKWGLADGAACECGEPEQTADHIITTCPLYKPPSEAGLFDVGPETRAWLNTTDLDIF